MEREPVLVVNSGSSSLKLGLFAAGEDGRETAVVEGSASGVGKEGGWLVLKDGAGKEIHREALPRGSMDEALGIGLRRLGELGLPRPVAVGHRVVHGGPHLGEHQRITPEVLRTLEGAMHFAPLHIPASLALITETEKAFPGVPQYACFDTVFHNTMPECAKRLPLPGSYWEEGVRRYGFHGLSYESIVAQFGGAVPGRMVVAHLGSGCSVAAISGGKSVDTSMGLTPCGGVVMATRTGDLDPGVLLYLMRVKGMDAAALETMLNHECGLAGLAEGGGDMQALEKATAAGDQGAATALEVFDRTVAKTVAGYASVLGGLDTLVFTGGIGEHSERTRRKVCAGLRFCGVEADGSGAVAVRVMPSEEELQIARHCRRLMGA